MGVACGDVMLQEVAYEAASTALQRDYLRNNKVINLQEHVPMP